MYRCVFIGCIFEFHHYQWNAIDKQDNIGPFAMFAGRQGISAFDNGKLIGYNKIVIVWIFKVNEPHPVAPFVAIYSFGNRNAFRQQAVKHFIVDDQFRRCQALYCFNGFGLCVGWDASIDSLYRLFYSAGQQNLFIVRPFRVVSIRGNVGRIHVFITQFIEQFNGKGFDDMFGDACQCLIRFLWQQ